MFLLTLVMQDSSKSSGFSTFYFIKIWSPYGKIETGGM